MSDMPKLRHQEQQGDLFCNQTETLSLAQQSGIDHGSRQLANEQRERDQAEQLKLTPQFSGVDALARAAVSQISRGAFQ